MGETEELTALIPGLAAQDAVHGFVERYDRWTGRAWLYVRGVPGANVRIGPGYRRLRTEIRARFPGRPIEAEWSDGTFPPAPFGAPVSPVLLAAYALGATACVAGAWVGGAAGASVSVFAAGWPLVRLVDAATVRRRGVRLGPPWAPLTPWHEVLEVGVHRHHVWVRTKRGGGRATLPRVLVPALRGRVARLGALAVVDRPPGTAERYAIWRQVAPGVPWGVLGGTLAAMWLTPDPWATLAAGLVVMAGMALLGAVVEARGSGWGLGGVAWLTLLHGLLLLVVLLAVWLS